MIARFLDKNRDKTILLVWGMDTYTGILRFVNNMWIVEGQAFDVSQISTCGYLDNPYVVVI